ncbi:hypothetical protein ACFQL4_22800 [Halosimplex aquaticum]
MTDDAPTDPPDGGPDESSHLVGEGVARREDAALLTGDATFTDDVDAADLAYLTFVRSEEAHAEIESVDATAAASIDGVLAVYTWDDIAASDVPGCSPSPPTGSTATRPATRCSPATGSATRGSLSRPSSPRTATAPATPPTRSK